MQKTASADTVQIGILVLAIATAVIHIVLAIPANLTMFYLNGAGYILLALALVLPQFKRYRSLIRWALIGFTLITIIGWVFVGERSAIAYIDKIIEVALVALLWIDRKR